jgi:hypothetical protein
VCQRDPDCTVSCHIPDEVRGGARKADDLSTVHGCSACNIYLDQGGWIGRITWTVVQWHIIRAMQRTLRNRWDRGYFGDHPEPVRRAPRPRARKPKSQRAKIVGRTQIPSRPLRSKNELRKTGR